MLQNGYVLVLACGMLLCILTGGNIDLSVGAVICLVGGLAAVLISNKGMNPYLTIIICLVVGLLVGVWQGYWIGYKRIPPFITTLAGMFIFRGFGRLILDNKTVSIQNKDFLNVFTSYINIPGLDDDCKLFCTDRWYCCCCICNLQCSSFQSKQSKKRISSEYSIF